jgi:ADP-ribose pyrophosphatase YjhB (NUDIX family)
MTTIGIFSAIFDDQQRILLVKRAYGPMNWTTPGGRLEAGETPTQGLLREVHEESGYLVRPLRLIGVYSKPVQDDLVLSIEAEIVGRTGWQPDGEISESGFYGRDALPEPMNPYTRARILDAFDGTVAVLREFD